MQQIARVLLVLSALCLAMSAQAEIYKWVDADGQVHYSERAPEGQAEELNIKSAPASSTEPARTPQQRMEQQEKLLRSFAAEREIKEKQKAKQEKAEQERKKRCLQAQDTLFDYKNAGYLYERDATGKRRILSEEEKRQEEEKARKQVKRWCED